MSITYETGTATNYQDLLDKLVTFATTALPAIERYTVERNVTDAGEKEVVFKGVGVAGLDEFYFGIKTYSDIAGDYFNWRLQGYSGFLNTAEFDLQPGAIPESRVPILALWDDSVTYWFSASGRSIRIAVKVSTVYETAYLGFGLPYGQPNQLPFPLIVGGCGTGAGGERWSTTNDNHSAFFNPLGSFDDTGFRFRMGNWDSVNNSKEVNYTAPYIQSQWSLMGNSVNGNKDLFSIDYISTDNCYGFLEGFQAVSGQTSGAEDTMTADGKNYIIFPNVYRVDRSNYVAMEVV